MRTLERDEADREVLRYRAVKVFVFNPIEGTLVEKRGQNARGCPGLWDLGVSETVRSGEYSIDTAIRGLKEEVGINSEPARLKFLCSTNYNEGRMKRRYRIYVLNYDGALCTDNEETELAIYASEERLNELLRNEQFVPAGLFLWKHYEKLTKGGYDG